MIELKTLEKAHIYKRLDEKHHRAQKSMDKVFIKSSY